MKYEALTKLVERASKGDKVAFAELYETKTPGIKYYVETHIGRGHDAEDVSQEIGIKMFLNISKLQKPELFNAWLGSIVKNECNQMKRKASNMPDLVSIDDYHDSLLVEKMEFLPHEFLESDENKQMVLAALQELRPEHREALFSHYFMELTYSEVAAQMEKKEKTVSAYISRGRKELREILEEKTNKKFGTVQGIVAMPVLTEIFNWDAHRRCPPEQAHAMTMRLKAAIDALPSDAVSGGAATAAKTGAGASGMSSAVTTGIAIISSVVIGTIITVLALLNAPTTNPMWAGMADQTGQIPSLINETESFPQNNSISPGEGLEIGEQYDEYLTSDGSHPSNGEGGVVSSDDAAGTINNETTGSDEENAAAPGTGTGNRDNTGGGGSGASYVETPVSGTLLLKNASGGIVDSGNLLSGITMQAYNGNELIGSAVTEPDGSYAFDDLMIAASGSYTVAMSLPTDSIVAAAADNAFGRKTVRLVPGQAQSGVDFYTVLSIPPDGSVVFSGSDCACGHVNPTRIVINDSGIISTSNSWTITRDSDGAVVYTGTGAVISSQLASIYNSGANGTYTLSFVHTDETGNSAQIKKAIQIDTGTIEPNDYE